MGPLPIVNHFLELLGLEGLLDKYVPCRDARCSLAYPKGLGVLLRSILVEREPIYRQQETVCTFTPSLFGLTRKQVKDLRDDQIGRALDRLFLADRAALLTDTVVAVALRCDVRLDELHNDSTSVRFTGQYTSARGRSIRGRRGPWVTYGHSKDHRPDLKQLLFVMTTSSDGGLPVQFRCEDGNTNDTETHIETWEALQRAAGRSSFLYVADSKLCTYENMAHIHSKKGRFVTVLPRSRKEDAEFRRWIQTHEPEWEQVWNRKNPRRKYGPRDRWWVFRYPLPSREGWPVNWVSSSLLAMKQQQGRRERLARAVEELDELDKRLQGPRPRKRSARELEEIARKILGRLKVNRYLSIEVWQEEIHTYRQAQRGRPGAEIRYRRKTRLRLRLRWTINEATVIYDQKSDGMYPLLTNDRSLTPRQVLEAHKRQPLIEKRFEQVKTVHELAPVLLKNEGRIEAVFFLYFFVLMVHALIERQLRQAMRHKGITELPLYPEERCCKRPTSQQVLRLFAQLERHDLLLDGRIVQRFEPILTDFQQQVLNLLGISLDVYKSHK